MINGFWLLIRYILSIVMSVLLWFTGSDYSLGIFWPLQCMSSFDLRVLITHLVSFDHFIVCPPLIYGFWLLIRYLLTIVISVLLWFTASDYSFGIFWPLYCLSSFDLRFWLLIRYLLTIVMSVLLWFTTSDYSLGIFWPLHCLSSFDLRVLITD